MFQIISAISFFSSWKIKIYTYQCASICSLIINFYFFQDIAAKLLSLSQQRPRALCILSGTGIVSSVTLRQPASTNAGVSYEVKALTVIFVFFFFAKLRKALNKLKNVGILQNYLYYLLVVSHWQ
jgi:hypothetical protein